MGCRFEARCLDCGRRFMVDSGGGFRFHLLHCDTCGKTKSVRFEELGLIHLRYLKGLPGPYCVASSEHDRYVQEHLDLEPLPEDDYQREVEAVAGNCRCGGVQLRRTGPLPALPFDALREGRDLVSSVRLRRRHAAGAGVSAQRCEARHNIDWCSCLIAASSCGPTPFAAPCT